MSLRRHWSSICFSVYCLVVIENCRYCIHRIRDCLPKSGSQCEVINMHDCIYYEVQTLHVRKQKLLVDALGLVGLNREYTRTATHLQ